MLRRLSLIALLLALASPAWAQIAHVQSDCVSGNLFGGTNSYIYSYPTAITPGNLVTIGVVTAVRVVNSVAGSSTSYAIAGSEQNSGGFFRTYIWRAIAAGADTTATLTLSGGEADSTVVCFAEFSGAASDQSSATHNGAASSGATTHASGSVTPPTAHNVVVTYSFTTNGDYTFDSDFTRIDAAGAGSGGYMGYRIQTAATTQEWNTTSADPETVVTRISAFAGTEDEEPAPPRCTLALLGAGKCD